MTRSAPVLARVPRLGRLGGLELAARRVLEGLYAGRHRSPWHGSSHDFADHRAYQEGDDLRAIDWKAWGRSDRLLVRRWHDDRQLPLLLLVDGSASMAYGEPAKHARAALLAAALGLLALDQGDAVQAAACDRAVAWAPVRGGAGAAPALCDELGRGALAGAVDAAACLDEAGERLRRRTLVAWFGDLLADPLPLAAAAARLAARGHEVAVFQVLDATELRLPAAWGLSRFTDPEGALPEVAADAASAKAGYDTAMERHLAACGDACARAGADWTLCPGDRDPVALLAGWLARRRGRR
jgi:uncharacterized protein (DUF58 family)